MTQTFRAEILSLGGAGTSQGILTQWQRHDVALVCSSQSGPGNGEALNVGDWNARLVTLERRTAGGRHGTAAIAVSQSVYLDQCLQASQESSRGPCNTYTYRSIAPPPHWVLGTRLAALRLTVLEMPPRCLLRRLTAAPSRALSSTSSSYCSVVHSDPQGQAMSTTHSSVSTHSALQRQQLEFCCLLCGWDVACSTCPFNWFHFDPNKFRSKQRRRPGEDDVHTFRVSELDIQHALETLEIAVEPTNGFAKAARVTQQQVKDAFRVKALEWHPDCNADPEAETIFKEILQAYELLLAHAR